MLVLILPGVIEMISMNKPSAMIAHQANTAQAVQIPLQETASQVHTVQERPPLLSKHQVSALALWIALLQASHVLAPPVIQAVSMVT